MFQLDLDFEDDHALPKRSSRLPNRGFYPGCLVRIVKKALLRLEEDTESSSVMLALPGTACVVTQLGLTSRRLQVRIVDLEVEGWISCETPSGKKLIQASSSETSSEASSDDHRLFGEL